MELAETERISRITCPRCGHGKAETMPLDASIYFYECEECGSLLKPNEGDRCVFCSFGSVPCPPVQVSGRPGCCA